MKKTLALLLFVTTIISCSSDSKKNIKVDQIGYFTNSKKIAIIPNIIENEFYLINAKTDTIVFTGEISKAQKWQFSNELVRTADFSDFNKPGNYYITCDNKEVNRSFSFAISDSIYNSIAKSTLFYYYLARASTPILKEYAGDYARPMGHADDSIIVHESAASKNRPTGTIISSPKGWYDAGDFNKYTVNSGITTYTLLHLCELYPEYTNTLNLNIPHEYDSIPDLIEEILWNLEWMVTMQDPYDGGAYHKLTYKRFSEILQPYLMEGNRYVVMKTTAASLNLAATCAKASRVLKPWNSQLNGFADTCLMIAKKAYDWAEKNPTVYFKQPEGFTTGEYPDEKVTDEFVWASIELFLASGDDNYLTDSLENVLLFDVPSWWETGTLGIFSLLTVSEKPPSKLNKKALIDGLLQQADSLYNKYDTSAYKVSQTVFEWGSNGRASNEGILLLMAYRQTGNIKYLDASQAILHYINGNNPVNICYVTGFGTKSPVNLRDGLSMGDDNKNPLPGCLSGGPYEFACDDCGCRAYKHKEPALRFVDKDCSYMTNEKAINWNAAYAFLVNALICENNKNNE